MIKEIFKNLIELLDTEIGLYTQVRDLYTKKRELLVKNQVLDLAEVDTKVIEVYESIKKIDLKRVDATKMLGDNINCMSELISVAQEKCPKFVNSLKDRQVILEKLSTSLSVLNLTNMDLIKHGMTITDKKLGIIVDVCTPKANSYNAKGIQADKQLSVSTIVQDV